MEEEATARKAVAPPFLALSVQIKTPLLSQTVSPSLHFCNTPLIATMCAPLNSLSNCTALQVELMGRAAKERRKDIAIRSHFPSSLVLHAKSEESLLFAAPILFPNLIRRRLRSTPTRQRRTDRQTGRAERGEE